MTTVREATDGEVPAAATVLDAAMLETPDLRERAAVGDLLVAVDDDRVLGAAVLVSPEEAPQWAREAGADVHLVAVAVRRRRRGQGIGSALVAAAAERGRVTAGFAADLRPFYESLGFAVEPLEEGRCRGVREDG